MPGKDHVRYQIFQNGKRVKTFSGERPAVLQKIRLFERDNDHKGPVEAREASTDG